MSDMLPPSHGRIVLLAPANPAQGSEISITQPARVRWEIRGLLYTLVTTAGGGNRITHITFSVGAVAYMRLTERGSQAGGVTRHHQWCNEVSPGLTTGSDTLLQQLPSLVRFNNQVVIATYTMAIDALDQFQDVRLVVEEWIEPLA